MSARLFWTVAEFAQLLRVDRRSVIRSIHAGEIPATRVGRVHRIPATWVEQQIQGIGGERNG